MGLGFDWRLGLCLKFTRYRGGEGRGGGGDKSSTTFTLAILFAPPMLLPICRIPAFSISCRFPSVRGVCLDVAARRLVVLFTAAVMLFTPCNCV